MAQVRIGVLRGGTNNNDYQKSISSGSILLRALREHDNYDPHDILIDKEENWFLDGVPVTPGQLIHKIDLCISTIDKPLNKNGYVESIIRSLGIKCVHNPKSALRGYVPDSLKKIIESVGVRLPRQMSITEPDHNILKEIHNKFSPPYSINFVNKNGEINHIFHASNLSDVIDVFNHHQKEEEGNYLIEEYTPGDEWAVTIMPDFRGVKYYSLHPVYNGSINPAFKSNINRNNSAKEGFAVPNVREALDLYAKLTSGVLPVNIPTTFIFRHMDNRKPVLMRVIERYILKDDPLLINALEESSVSSSEFLDIILK